MPFSWILVHTGSVRVPQQVERRDPGSALILQDPPVLKGLEANLESIRLDRLRKAIRENRVSFPSQVPVFVKHGSPQLQSQVVLLYFVRGWTCEKIGTKYGFSRFYVWQILTHWKQYAVARGYLEWIPNNFLENLAIAKRKKASAPAA